MKKEKYTLVVNAFAGPGAGKTTSAWAIAAELKKRGMVVEYVPEYAKELVWEENFALLDQTYENQMKVYEEQKHRIDRLIGKVDVIVTDSPTVMSVQYLSTEKNTPEQVAAYRKMAVDDFKKYHTFNYFILRGNIYEQEGRIQTFDEAKSIDRSIKEFLRENKIYFGTYQQSSLGLIADNIEKHCTGKEHLPFAKHSMPEEEKELAVKIADRYILMQECEEGYDYSILDEMYYLLDGGVYTNQEITIQKAMYEIIADLKEPKFSTVTETYYRDDYLQGKVSPETAPVFINYAFLSGKMEEAEQKNVRKQGFRWSEQMLDAVESFRARTEVRFRGLGSQTPDDIEKTVAAYVQSQIEEYGLDVEILDAVLTGSRSRGLEHEGSDVDVVVEYTGSMREDDFFNLLHKTGLLIEGTEVDINPIREGETGGLETYLPTAERYLMEKEKQMQEKEEFKGCVPARMPEPETGCPRR